MGLWLYGARQEGVESHRGWRIWIRRPRIDICGYLQFFADTDRIRIAPRTSDWRSLVLITRTYRLIGIEVAYALSDEMKIYIGLRRL